MVTNHTGAANRVPDINRQRATNRPDSFDSVKTPNEDYVSSNGQTWPKSPRCMIDVRGWQA